MTREQAMGRLSVLAIGLDPSPEGVARLLERITSTACPELLRAYLVEEGARALLGFVAGDGPGGRAA